MSTLGIIASAGGVSFVSATGGTEVTSGGYKYHTFTAAGTFTVSAGGDVEVLCIAGGGGGGDTSGSSDPGGGGGGGGQTSGSSSTDAGQGGSGIVIIRYQIA